MTVIEIRPYRWGWKVFSFLTGVRARPLISPLCDAPNCRKIVAEANTVRQNRSVSRRLPVVDCCLREDVSDVVSQLCSRLSADELRLFFRRSPNQVSKRRLFHLRP